MYFGWMSGWREQPLEGEGPFILLSYPSWRKSIWGRIWSLHRRMYFYHGTSSAFLFCFQVKKPSVVFLPGSHAVLVQVSALLRVLLLRAPSCHWQCPAWPGARPRGAGPVLLLSTAWLCPSGTFCAHWLIPLLLLLLLFLLRKGADWSINGASCSEPCWAELPTLGSSAGCPCLSRWKIERSCSSVLYIISGRTKRAFTVQQQRASYPTSLPGSERQFVLLPFVVPQCWGPAC